VINTQGEIVLKTDEHEIIECDVTLLVPREDSARGYLWGAFSRLVRRQCTGVLETARFELTSDVIESLKTTEGVGRLKAQLRHEGVNFIDVVSVVPCEYEMGFFRS